MNFDQFQAASLRTAKVENDSLKDNLVHASLGLTTEVGEFVTEVKRIARYGKAMTPEMRDHMIEELGDVLWYVALAAGALGTSMTVMAEQNVAKLLKRYPIGFTNEAAEARADKQGQSVEQERAAPGLFEPAPAIPAGKTLLTATI